MVKTFSSQSQEAESLTKRRGTFPRPGPKIFAAAAAAGATAPAARAPAAAAAKIFEIKNWPKRKLPEEILPKNFWPKIFWPKIFRPKPQITSEKKVWKVANRHYSPPPTPQVTPILSNNLIIATEKPFIFSWTILFFYSNEK